MRLVSALQKAPSLKRRHFLGATLALAANYAMRVPFAKAATITRARPNTPNWPTDADWSALNKATHGRLSRITLPKLNAPDAKKLLANPFYIADDPSLTQSSGWLDAWHSSPSAYSVAAETANDIAAAVSFAREHNIRLVIKGRGHSYLGASSAPDSLLVWTRKMDAVTVHEAFVPAGSKNAPVPAVSVGAGCMWLHAYQAVTTGAGRYVQGGGCTTVGVAGLVQGGGFGSFSKNYGSAAASLLEAEIVTADATTRVVNAVQEPDLFWALKGGGGGTFGIVTRLTLATHELPKNFGAVMLTLNARSAEAYRRLLARFIDHYTTHLFNPHWGEQVIANPYNRLEIKMLFQGLTAEEARAAWQPFIDFAEANPADYDGQKSMVTLTIPARDFWNPDYYRNLLAAAITHDSREGAKPTDFWWTGDGEQVGAFWHAYSSAWLPASLLKPDNRASLVNAWFAASRHWPVAGAIPATLDATRNTAMHPDVLDSFALAIIAADGPPAFSGQSFLDQLAARSHRAKVQSAMTTLRAAAPDTGAYVNECDYFQPNWQKALWGTNYPRLANIKKRYDPDALFFVRHGVGSENWSEDGFTRTF
jgi:FAD/FMN-containing dehydrogenase